MNSQVQAQLKQFNSKEPDLRVSAQTDSSYPDLVILSLEGSLDTENATAFHRSIDEVMTTLESCRILVFDLHRLKYISSSGIGAFTNILVAAERYGYQIFLYRLSANVRVVFDTLGFSQFFRLIEDWGEVREYIAGKRA
ncbi:MAG: anti-sigma factor antagonist [Spirochaetes bacterium]|nr:anti-sigma factor antagonist [Spirochaetota bacterium]